MNEENYEMAHRTRHEQLAMKVRKDPNKLAKRTKQHEPKPAYKRAQLRKEDYYNVKSTI